MRQRGGLSSYDPISAVDLGGGGRDLPAHRLDLLRPKGRCVSRRSIFASRSSAVIVSSPTLACSRSIAASRASAGRLLRRLARGQERVAPATQLGGGHAEFAGDQLQVLA